MHQGPIVLLIVVNERLLFTKLKHLIQCISLKLLIYLYLFNNSSGPGVIMPIALEVCDGGSAMSLLRIQYLSIALSGLAGFAGLLQSCKKADGSRLKAIASASTLKTGMFMPLEVGSALSDGKNSRITNPQQLAERLSISLKSSDT